MKKEVWKDIKGYEGKYLISSWGRVKSLSRKVKAPEGWKQRTTKDRILKPCDYRGEGYPIVALSDGNRNYRSHRIHRLLADHFLGAKPGQVVDHIDGNRTNNCLGNLRLCTHSQNCANQRTNRTRKYSKYRGVSKSKGKWFAQIQWLNKHYNLGSFSSEKEAALAYNKAASDFHKEYAVLNEVE